jgi:tripartite-type tricarboxylate transporter receptor subunit TctC
MSIRDLVHASMRLAGAAIFTALVASPAWAQADFPNREIHVICAYAPGTGADIITRFWAEKLGKVSGKTIVVENKPGALTAIGAEFVKQAKPDGYTILITAGNSTMASNPFLFKKLSYDPQKDFTPVTTLMTLPFVLGVDPKSPIKSVPELTALLKQKGDKASFGYSSSFALAATELYQSIAGTKAIRVSYKGTPEIMPDLAGGQLDFIFSDATYLLGQEREGRFRALAVTTAKRSALAPHLPSMQEAGVPGYELSAWWGAWLPAGAPQPIVDKFAGWLNQAVALPETKSGLAPLGAEPFPGNAKVIAELLPKSLEQWGKVIKLAGIEPQ